MDKPATYTPHIDGLRALAVLSVLLFHLDVAAFGGGYVGVDVFFVISGFLITRLIHEELEHGSFSFRRFYLRRARRLLPAAFFTFAVCTLLAFWLFAPSHLVRFGGEQLFAMVSLSNFYFWQEAGYFDTLEQFKPLLHTWSLSVEEQFYLLWPALLSALMLCKKRWTLPAFVILSGTGSLWLAEAALHQDGKAAAFFLAPYRIYEFGIGALLVWLKPARREQGILTECLALAGFALILFPVFSFSRSTAFPGIHALMPCLGAALLIYSGSARYAGSLLSSRVSVGIGLISYSLYLIHWPLIVFYKYYTLDALSLYEQAALFATSILLACGMYRWVEKPFRKPGYAGGAAAIVPVKIFLSVSAIAASLIAGASSVLWYGDGWLSRFPADIQTLFVSMREDDADRQKAIRAPECHFNKKGQGFEAFEAGLAECNRLQADSILVLGDSHAADLYVGFSRALPHRNIVQMTGAGCGAVTCPEFMRYAVEYAGAVNKQIGAVFYTQRGQSFLRDDGSINTPLIEQTKIFLRQFQDKGIAVYWFGPQVEHSPDMDAILAGSADAASFAALAVKHQERKWWELDAALLQATEGSGIIYVSKLQALCSGGTCPVLDEKQRLLYPDYGQWTVAASGRFANALLKLPALSGFAR